MNCKDYQNQMASLVDAPETDEGLGQLRQHIVTCEKCQLAFDAWRGMLGDLKALGGAEPPSGLNERIKQSISSEAAHKVESDSGSGVGEPSTLRRLGTFRVAAAAAAMLFAAWTIWGERGDQQNTSSKLTETAATEWAPPVGMKIEASEEKDKAEPSGGTVIRSKIGKLLTTPGAQKRSKLIQVPASSNSYPPSPSINSQVIAFLKDDTKRSVNGLLIESGKLGSDAGLEDQLLAKVNEILVTTSMEPPSPGASVAEGSRGRTTGRDLKKSYGAAKLNRVAEIALSPTAKVVFLRSAAALEKVKQLCQTADQRLMPVIGATDGAKIKGAESIEHWKITLSEKAAARLEASAQRWGAVSVRPPTPTPTTASKQHPVKSKEAAKPNQPKPRMTLHFLLPVHRK